MVLAVLDTELVSEARGGGAIEGESSVWSGQGLWR
jgi:hypothetical protein